MLPISQAKSKFDSAISHFEEEMKSLRVGRPTPDMFAKIQVEAYGAKQNLEGVGNINIVDATLVTIQPWDKTLAQAVAKGVQEAQLGFNPQVEGDMVRIPIPPLTQEKREEYVKRLRALAEEAKISIRMTRKDVMDWLASEKDQGNITEDDQKAEEKRLQEMVDDTNKKIDELTKSKEESLMTV